MNFTDIFIRRPVLATVVSLLIVVLGLRSLFSLPVNQYPRTQNAVVTVSTAYYGADAQTVAGFITQPLESAIAQAQGIDFSVADKQAIADHVFTLYGLVARFGAVLDFATAEAWKREKEKLPEDLDDDEQIAIETGIANGLRAGSSFLQAIELVVREARPPISTEFARVIREVNLGLAFDEALENMVRRVRSDDLELMATAMLP